MASPEQQAERGADPRIVSAQTFEELYEAIDKIGFFTDSKGRKKNAGEIKALIGKVIEMAKVFERANDQWGAEDMIKKIGITSNAGLRDRVVDLIKREYKLAT